MQRSGITENDGKQSYKRMAVLLQGFRFEWSLQPHLHEEITRGTLAFEHIFQKMLLTHYPLRSPMMRLPKRV